MYLLFRLRLSGEKIVNFYLYQAHLAVTVGVFRTLWHIGWGLINIGDGWCYAKTTVFFFHHIHVCTIHICIRFVRNPNMKRTGRNRRLRFENKFRSSSVASITIRQRYKYQAGTIIAKMIRIYQRP